MFVVRSGKLSRMRLVVGSTLSLNTEPKHISYTCG